MHHEGCQNLVLLCQVMGWIHRTKSSAVARRHFWILRAMEKQLPISVSTARGPEVALTDAAVRTVQINRVPWGGAACRWYVHLCIFWPAFFILPVQRTRRVGGALTRQLALPIALTSSPCARMATPETSEDCERRSILTAQNCIAHKAS